MLSDVTYFLGLLFVFYAWEWHIDKGQNVDNTENTEYMNIIM